MNAKLKRLLASMLIATGALLAISLATLITAVLISWAGFGWRAQVTILSALLYFYIVVDVYQYFTDREGRHDE